MLPVLLKIGPFPIHSYGLLIAIGFLSAVWVMNRLAIRSGLNAQVIGDLAFRALISGFIGGRILFVITRWDYFSDNLLAIFKVWEGGFVFYGGVILAFFVSYHYLRKHRQNIWLSADVAMMGLTLAHAFGRLGCFAAGCCYGKPTDVAWGIRFFSPLVDSDFRGIPLHPTQLYESFSMFVLFAGLWIIFKRRVFDGQAALTYFMAYPIIRSIVEIYRGDSIRGFVVEGILSTSQFISILVFLAALSVAIYRYKQIKGAKAI